MQKSAKEYNNNEAMVTLNTFENENERKQNPCLCGGKYRKESAVYRQVSANSGNFGQVWESLGKFGQVWAVLKEARIFHNSFDIKMKKTTYESI